MLTGTSIWASTGAQLQLPELEVLLEVVPLLFGGFSVFRLGALRAACGEEGPVGADEFLVEDGDVGLSGVQILMSHQLCGDADRQPVADGIGGPDSAEVVRRVAQRLAGGVGETRAGQCLIEQVSIRGCAGDFPDPAVTGC
jgi:hypothetical protein